MERTKDILWGYRWVILPVQLLICSCVFFSIYFCQRSTQKIELAGADLRGGYTLEDGSIHIDETDGAYGLYMDVNTREIEKGWYKLHIGYETGYDDNGFLVRPLNGNPDAINKDLGDGAETIALKSQNKEKSVHVWAKEATGLQVSFHFCGGGYLDIKSITLERVADYTPAFFLFFVFLITDLFFREAVQTDPAEWKRRNAIRTGIVLIAIIACIPLMNRYILMGHDQVPHLYRIEGIAEGLCSGQFPVRIMPQWWNGYGYAQSMFYGDILLYFPAVLLLLNYKLQTAFKCYIAFINLLTAWISYKCFAKIGKNDKIALLGSALYTLTLFRLMNLYFSNAMGAYTAMTFLPLVITGFYCIKEKRGWVYLALGLTGCLQSHLMSCEMTGIFIILFLLLRLKWVFQKTVFFNLCKAGVAALLWNLWFLVPFLNLYPGEYKFKIMEDFQTNIQQDGIALGDWFRTVYASLNGETDVFYLGRAAGIALVCGLLFAFMVIIIKRNTGEMKYVKVSAGVIGGALMALFLTTKYFPYDFLSEKNKILATLIHSLQFPWRFLEIAAILSVTAVVFGLVILDRSGHKKACFIMAGILGGICLLETSFYYQRLLIESPQMAEVSEYYALPEYMGIIEYLPVAAETLYEKSQPVTSGDMVEIVSYEKEYTTILTSCINHSEQEAYMDVPLFFYPCYKAKDLTTGEILVLTYGENAKIRIILSAGYQGMIELKVSERKLWRIAELISILSILITIYMILLPPRYRGQLGGIIKRLRKGKPGS